MRKSLALLWGAISDYLRTEYVKNYIKESLASWFISALKLQALGGFRGWLVKTLAIEAAEEIQDHVINPLIRKIGYYAEIENGKSIIKKMDNASDYDEWSDNAHKL